MLEMGQSGSEGGVALTTPSLPLSLAAEDVPARQLRVSRQLRVDTGSLQGMLPAPFLRREYGRRKGITTTSFYGNKTKDTQIRLSVRQ